MVKYKEKWESVKVELDNLRSRMNKQSMTIASIAIYPDEIDDKEFDKIKRDFYRETELNNIRFELISKNSMSIIGPGGIIGVADDFFKGRGWEVEYADLIVLRRLEK